MRGYFIAGTDTGVGKTQVARALCSLIPGAVPLKPAETGCEDLQKPEDALALREAAHSSLPLDQICPFRFRMPAAPLVAADAEGRTVDVMAIEKIAAAATGPLIVEAAGGLLVPLAREIELADADPATTPPPERIVTNLDLAERLGLPVILVARAGLGTLNHSALSLEALEGRGIKVAAVVLNRTVEHDDPSVASNAQWVAAMTGARVLGPGPFEPDAAARPSRLGELLGSLVDTLRDRR